MGRGGVEDRGSQSAEIAALQHAALRQGGNAGGDGARLADADALVIGKEESLVSTDAATGSGPEFVAAEGRLGHTQAIVEEGVGVELVVTQEFVGGTVK